MNIQGVEILTQKIIFSPTWQGIATWAIIMCLTFFFALLWLEKSENWVVGLIPLICFVFFVISLALTYTDNSKTFLNYPSKTEYTIEIIDDNAWKELGPNYTVKEKAFENKEIYIVEGDYVE